jgi:hypothetical protein
MFGNVMLGYYCYVGFQTDMYRAFVDPTIFASGAFCGKSLNYVSYVDIFVTGVVRILIGIRN